MGVASDAVEADSSTPVVACVVALSPNLDVLVVAYVVALWPNQDVPVVACVVAL